MTQLSLASRSKESMLFRVFGLAVLVAAVLILVMGLRAGRVRTEQKAIGLVEKALWLYRLEFGAFPASGQEQAALEAHVSNAYFADFQRRWPNRKGLRDYWGRPLIIQPGRHNPRLLDIYSVGPNGRDEAGDGDDIKNWPNPRRD